MLIQVQSQTERDKAKLVSDEVKSNFIKPNEYEETDNHVKKPEPSAVNSDKDLSSDVDKPKPNLDDIHEKNPGNGDSDSINIDPKTYCKLGHFHLLLEDNQKGVFKSYFVIYISEILDFDMSFN